MLSFYYTYDVIVKHQGPVFGWYSNFCIHLTLPLPTYTHILSITHRPKKKNKTQNEQIKYQFDWYHYLQLLFKYGS